MTTDTDRLDKQRVAADLEDVARDARALAEKLGLDPYDVNYWIVDHDEMNELIAYNGFQTRYPHWRWGMQYDRQQKQSQYLGGKAFEIVNNDDPAAAFLQESNTLADQKAVITHVEAHADFFANNQWFDLYADNPDAAATLERHADLIEDHMSDPEVSRDDVEEFIDSVLCIENVIDQHRPYTDDLPEAESERDDLADRLDDLGLSEDVKRQVFDDDWLDANAEDAERDPEPAEDLLAFLALHGKAYDEDAGKAVEYEDWQRAVIEALRREAYYFAPQKTTKVMNEGWACVAPETPVFTENGLVPMSDVVENRPDVSDGERSRGVYDANVIPDHDTVTVRTRRGLELTGSNNHRIRRPDGTWVRLDELDVGDEVEVSGGSGLWPTEEVDVSWENPTNVTLDDVAEEVGVSVWTVMQYRQTGRAQRASAIADALEAYDGEDQSIAQRERITVPERVTVPFGRFLGLLLGDGHVSAASSAVGFTTASEEHAREFASLVSDLFDVDPTVEQDGSRWRVFAYNRNLVNFLTETFDLPTGNASAEKTVPDAIRRSPADVVAAFIRGLFDADGYAGEQGAILSTKSTDMSATVQQLLLNFDVLSRRREQTDGCYHVHLTGRSAKRFAKRIGFGYDEKAERLDTYLDDLAWFERESWTDEIAAIETGTGDVYDISVDTTHRYAGAGFVNHNSHWESLMMGEEAFAGADEFVDYADHQSRVLNSPGLNPYSLGKQLWEYVENTANRREVVKRLLRVEGVSWRNFHDAIDFEDVQAALAPPDALDSVDADSLDALDDLPEQYVDAESLERARAGEIDVDVHPWRVLTYEGLARRHYSLAKPQYRGFLRSVSRAELERTARYLFDESRYATVEEALADVDFAAGWDRIYAVRESHNDVTFIDEFLTQEFVDANGYFAYEFSRSTSQYHVTSTDAEAVKKKLLLKFANFGKPSIVALDANHRNRGELLLGHRYNGVALDLPQAREVLERVFDLWGRPVALRTVVTEVSDRELERARRQGVEPDPEEVGLEVRYDGSGFEEVELDDEALAGLQADAVDYDTKPEEWLA